MLSSESGDVECFKTMSTKTFTAPMCLEKMILSCCKKICILIFKLRVGNPQMLFKWIKTGGKTLLLQHFSLMTFASFLPFLFVKHWLFSSPQAFQNPLRETTGKRETCL